MDFQDEIGKTFQLVVSRWKSKHGESIVGFGAEFINLDELLYRNRTPGQRARDEREMDDFDYSLERLDCCHHASMRIYHISGEPLAPLVEGDCWSVEVVTCYLNPRELLTKDNRQKIHYSVRPLERVERVEQRCLFHEKPVCVVTDYYCGRNHRREVALCPVVGWKRYRIETTGEIVEVYVAIATGIQDPFWDEFKITSINRFFEDQRRMLGPSIDQKRVRKILKELPFAPGLLLKHIGRA